MMTEMALTVQGLCKAYPRFHLEDVTLHVPRGTVVGLIGENGAGKSTLIGAALGLVKKDAGTVSVLGKETLDAETLGQVGVVFDGNNFPDVFSPAKLGRVLKRIYPSWDEPRYAALLDRLGVPQDQKLSEMSKGTRTKLSIVTALSHGSRLLVLDEPTSGLDPVSRDELLEIFLQLAQDEGISILFSTHITSDLEKCADHIVYLRRGEVAADADADALRARYRTAALTAAQRDAAPEGLLLGCKREREGFSALLRAEDAPRLGADTAPASLEDIMVHLEKEDGGL